MLRTGDVRSSALVTSRAAYAVARRSVIAATGVGRDGFPPPANGKSGRLAMRRSSSLAAALAVVLVAVFAQAAQAGDVAENTPRGKAVSEFIGPDGRFDLEAARRSGYEGSLDTEGFAFDIDPASGRPLLRPLAAAETTADPDDVYWDNSMSPSVAGVGPSASAATVYDGRLIVGGGFVAAGDVAANYIASWDGNSWSPLGQGMNDDVSALTLYDGRLIAGGSFTTAGGVPASRIASWDGSIWSPLGSGLSSLVVALTV